MNVNHIKVYPNSGILFFNKKKSEENHPDYTGAAEVNGKLMEVSAWIKTDVNDNGLIRIAFREPKVNRVSDRRVFSNQDD